MSKATEAPTGPAAAKKIDELVEGLGDWRAVTLAQVRRLIHEAVPEVVETWKWMASPVWEKDGILVVGNAHKQKVKLTFPQGAQLSDPEQVFNNGLGGKAPTPGHSRGPGAPRTYAGECLHDGNMPMETTSLDAVFKALADPTRRLLLDRLREHDGQTLGQLCEHLVMARQSATQHLDVLVRAHLVTVVRRGRERLHYLNPTPIHQIEQRWISTFDKPRLNALDAIRDQAEEYAMTTSATSVPTYVYVTYIRASTEQVWRALTNADVTARYWGHANVSDWEPGSRWEHRRADGSGRVDLVGRVLETDPPTRLVITFGESADEPDNASVVTFLIEPHHDIVRLTVTHENLADPSALQEISHGWPAVLANLKSLLETGEVLPRAPWEMSPVHH